MHVADRQHSTSPPDRWATRLARPASPQQNALSQGRASLSAHGPPSLRLARGRAHSGRGTRFALCASRLFRVSRPLGSADESSFRSCHCGITERWFHTNRRRTAGPGAAWGHQTPSYGSMRRAGGRLSDCQLRAPPRYRSVEPRWFRAMDSRPRPNAECRPDPMVGRGHAGNRFCLAVASAVGRRRAAGRRPMAVEFVRGGHAHHGVHLGANLLFENTTFRLRRLGHNLDADFRVQPPDDPTSRNIRNRMLRGFCLAVVAKHAIQQPFRRRDLAALVLGAVFFSVVPALTTSRSERALVGLAANHGGVDQPAWFVRDRSFTARLRHAWTRRADRPPERPSGRPLDRRRATTLDIAQPVVRRSDAAQSVRLAVAFLRDLVHVASRGCDHQRMAAAGTARNGRARIRLFVAIAHTCLASKSSPHSSHHRAASCRNGLGHGASGADDRLVRTNGRFGPGTAPGEPATPKRVCSAVGSTTTDKKRCTAFHRSLVASAHLRIDRVDRPGVVRCGTSDSRATGPVCAALVRE